VNQSGRHLALYCLYYLCRYNLSVKPFSCSLDAARVRKEYDESSAKLSKIQSRISSLTQKLKHDFG